ncbi:hypothetical protein C8Q73DRAFT_792339 [Cubamyces lactineus]|nr:hypothetical protein C8Q73DRAFT_792339 [Cubamyces lactineus]
MYYSIHIHVVELEEQAKAATDAVQVQRLKEEREAWVRALKEKSGSDSSEVEIKDFAPPSHLPRSTPRKKSFEPPEHSDVSADSFDMSSGPPSFDAEEDGEVHPDSYFLTPPASIRDSSRVGSEYAIVSQLLSKVRELEEANAQIKEQQKITEERMRAAQWDVDSIKRVYEYLDVADIDLEDPEEEHPVYGLRPGRVPSGGTIRFSSLRKTLVSDMSKLLASGEAGDFAGGITKDMQSTVREEPGHRSALGHKSRKSVVGLFDSQPNASGSSDNQTPTWGDYPPALKVSLGFRTVPPAPDEPDTSVWSVAATDGIAPPSPSLSALQAPLDGPQTGISLWSELGSEYGDWPDRGFNHHLRTSSLYDLVGLNAPQSVPGSPTESHAAPPLIVFRTAEDDPQGEHVAGPSTPPRTPALQLNIEPPTPTPDRLRSPAQVRQHYSRDAADVPPDEEPPEDRDKSIELRRLSLEDGATVADPTKREGFIGLVLEAWLWLQFIIVVMLFLWAMAKRGPKVVLEAERRNAHRAAGQ